MEHAFLCNAKESEFCCHRQLNKEEDTSRKPFAVPNVFHNPRRLQPAVFRRVEFIPHGGALMLRINI